MSPRAPLVPTRFLLALSLLGALAASPRAADAAGVAFDSLDAPFADVLAKAKARSEPRLVVVELFTERCTWCRALERDTFRAADVGNALKDDLCVRYDAGSATGRPVAERYRVGVFPTTLFLDADGEEVDRVVGFAPPPRFVDEVARMRAGRDTLKSLRAAHAATPSDARLGVAFARKLARAGDAEAAERLLTPLVEAPEPDASALPAALLGLAEIASRAGDVRTADARLATLLDEHGDAPEAADAWILRVDLLARQGSFAAASDAVAAARRLVRGDAKLALLEERLETFERVAYQATLLRWGERADAAGDLESLGRAAKAALDRRLLVGTALRWAERVARATPDDVASLEVHSDLLAETGSPEKALAVATAALPLAREGEERARIERRIANLRAAMGRPAPAPTAEADAPGPTRGGPGGPTPGATRGSDAAGDELPPPAPRPSSAPCAPAPPCPPEPVPPCPTEPVPPCR